MTSEKLIDEAVGAKIRIQRLNSGLSAEAISKVVGVSVAQIESWELGRDRIQPSQLLDVAKALGVNAAYLFPNKRGSTPSDNLEQVSERMVESVRF